MKTSTIHELRAALKEVPEKELIEICLRLAKFKKENKELLTYLLFEEAAEDNYVLSIKDLVRAGLTGITSTNAYHTRKAVRKVLRDLKKYIKYSQNKVTEVELLIDFCEQLHNDYPKIKRDPVVLGICEKVIEQVNRKLKNLHEDLQFDYEQRLLLMV